MDSAGPFLDRVKIASPCPESWETMAGDSRVRACDRCRLNVYNLSDMTRSEAEALVRQTEGRLCIRYYRRRDGTVQTRDCPEGVGTFRKRLALAAGSLLLLGGIGFGLVSRDRQNGILRNSPLRTLEPFATLLEWIDPPSITGIRG